MCGTFLWPMVETSGETKGKLLASNIKRRNLWI